MKFSALGRSFGPKLKKDYPLNKTKDWALVQNAALAKGNTML